jgi:lipopolysaccharide/colanic/teichoic acid biosynthesis glycosyltransferase
MKRATDVAVSGLVLASGAPLWLAIGLVIRATSPGPALYSRQVVGQNGRFFTYYKFRSMRAGDDSHHRDWLRDFVSSDKAYVEHDGKPVFKAIDDSRITPIGKYLRRSSLDEIPQLINVLRGEMSLIGPRPPIIAEYELYDATMRRRLAVRPGITGYYQVSARSQVPFSRMLALDCEYIARRSFLLDVKILVRTPLAMIKGSGAA